METFIALSECNSFTEAAKRLYCSQPTISNHIQQLEEVFESRLFHRAGKTAQLTAQGEVLLPYAKKFVSLFEEAALNIKMVDKQEQVLSIYMSNYIAKYYFSNHFYRLQEINPLKSLEVNNCCYHELKRCFKDGLTDFAIMPIYPEDEEIFKNFDILHLFEDEFVLVFPAYHAWKNRKVLYSRDLQNEMVLLPQSFYLKQLITKSLAEQQINVRYSQMGDFELIKLSVQAGYGIAFLPSTAVESEIAKGHLITLPISSLNIRRDNGVVVRKGVSLTSGEQTFCNNLIENLCESIS